MPEKARNSGVSSHSRGGRLKVEALFLLVLAATGLWIYWRSDEPNGIDEAKYIVLAEKWSWELTDYSLRDTALLNELSQDVNDVPLFYHPPLGPILLHGIHRLFRAEYDSPTARRYRMLPVLMHLLIAACLWWGWLANSTDAARVWTSAIYLSAAIPGYFAGQVLLEAQQAALIILALTIARHAARQAGYRWWWATGIVMGLALLTKASAAWVLPAHLLLLLHWIGPPPRWPWRAWLLPCGVAAAIAAPWYVSFYATYGMLLPDWLAPTLDSIRRFPFLAFMLSRPPWFYPAALLFFAPATLLGLALLWKRHTSGEAKLLGLLGLAILALFSFLGERGAGYQTRYVLVAIPLLSLATGPALARSPRSTRLLAAGLCLYSFYNLVRNLRFPTAGLLVYLPWMDGPWIF